MLPTTSYIILWGFLPQGKGKMPARSWGGNWQWKYAIVLQKAHLTLQTNLKIKNLFASFERIHQTAWYTCITCLPLMPASPYRRILKNSCDAVGLQPHPPHLCGDSRQAKRKASGFTTSSDNCLASLILIEKPSFGHPRLEVVWSNSQLFLFIY